MSVATRLTKLADYGSSHRQGSIHAKYVDILKALGPPDNDPGHDTNKVGAYWTFQDENGRKAAVWAYQRYAGTCTCFSCHGDSDLLRDVFGDNYERWPNA